MHKLSGYVGLLTHPTAAHLIAFFGLLAVAAAAVFFLVRMQPATLVCLGVGAEAFSGDWRYMHIPLPVDRVLFVLAFGSLIWRGTRAVSDRTLVFHPIHVLLVAIVVYVTCSAIWAGTLTTSLGFYALLDRLGVIPFIMFTLAPLLFRDRRARNLLLVVLVVLGLYLAMTAWLEGLGLLRFVEPAYIRNPTLGIHFGRARGPFLESVADGMCMFICAVASAVALTEWRHRLARLACFGVIGGSAIGIIFTLTRANWLSAAIGTIVAMACDRRLRRRLPAVLVVGAVAVIGALELIPGLSTKASDRANQLSPVWDRYNTNDAALRAWRDNPIFGIGWETFVVKGPDYLRQAAGYPLTGVGLEVHNVFLSHLVELGVPGVLMWSLALFSAVGAACVRRPPGDLDAWRTGLIAIFVAFLITADVGPFSYALPNLLLWMWAGIVAADRYSRPRAAAAAVAAGPDPARLARGDLVSVGP
jgi:putative inorganic carbon (HCO3(-)) transporter